MDPFTQKLLDRTRQRREDLAKKLKGSTPAKRPVAPMKESNSRNVQEPLSDDETSPVKRHCFRQNEANVHPDTPAIPGVQSRLKKLVTQRTAWDAGNEDAAPSPMLKSRDPSPPSRRARPSIGARRGRLAALAKDINDWEDDLSHPSVKSSEEKPAKGWKPPHQRDAEEDDSPAPVKPPRTFLHNKAQLPANSPSKGSNNKNVIPDNSKSPSRFPRQARNDPPARERFVSPTKDSSSNAPRLAGSGGTGKYVSEAKLTVSAKKKPEEKPTKNPVTSRLGMWEKRVQNNTPPSPGRKDTAGNDDDPTNKPVNARMAAWAEKASGASKTPRPKPLKPVSSKLSFSEAIASRAKQFQDRQDEDDVPKSPAEIVSPKAHQGLQQIQEKLYTKTHDGWKGNDIAEKCKTQKQKDLETLRNRWKSGMKEEDYTVSSTPIQRDLDDDFNVPPRPLPAKDVYKGHVVSQQSTGPEPMAPPRMNANKRKMTRDENKQQKRSEFENKLTAMGFEVGTGASPLKKCAKTRHTSDDDVIHRQNQAVTGMKGRHQSEQTRIDTVREETITKTVAGQAQVTPTQEYNEVTPRNPGDANPPAHHKIWTRVKTFNAGKDAALPQRKKRESEMMAMQNTRRSDSESDSETDGAQGSTSSTTVVEKGDNFTCETTVIVNSNADTSKTVTIQRKIQLDQEESQEDDSLPTQESECLQTESDFSEDEDLRNRKPSHQRHMPNWSRPASIPSSLGVEPLESSDRDIDSDMQESMEDRVHHYLSTSQTRYDRHEYRDIQRRSQFATSVQSEETEETTSYDGDNSSGTDDLCAEMDDLLEEDSGDEDDESLPPVGAYNCRTRKQSYKSPSPKKSYRSPSPKRDGEKQIVYNIDMYRSMKNTRHRPAPKMTIVRREHHGAGPEEEEELPYIPEKSTRQKIQELHDLVKQEQSVIIQTSNALNQCCSKNSTFAGSLEQVECNRVLLIACQKRQAYIEEIERLKKVPVTKKTDGCKGSLTISDIRLPLKKDFINKMQTRHDTSVHFFMCVLKNGPHILVTQMVSTHDGGMKGTLEIPNMFRINDLKSDFKFSLDIYSMSITREAEPERKKGSRFTPKKIFGKGKNSSQTPDHTSGAMSVRTTNFSLIASVPITLRSIHNVTFSLERVPFLSPLQGIVHMKLRCVLDTNVEERGFLTMFEDVTGLGNWYRRWCVLANNQIRYWKYPDDEYRKDPMGVIELKNCVTEHVGLIPRDICARPNTFEVVKVRPQRSSDKNTLVSWSYDTMTSIKHMLSADTKEDRVLWCNKLNQALKNIRTWQSDALQPIRQPKRVL